MLADSLLQESEWKQVFTGLQDSSQYSDRCQQCYSLYGLGSSSDFHLFHSPDQAFGNCSKRTNYKSYHFHVP